MNITQYENYQEKKTHGEINFPFVTYICTIPLDFKTVPLHWHEEMEIIYIKKGTGCISVNLNEFSVAEGSVIIVLPGQLHSIYTSDDTERMEYENIIFNPGILLSKQADTCSKDYLLPLFSGDISVPVHFHSGVPHYNEIAEILDNCDRAGEQKPYGEALYLKAQLFMLLFVLENKCQLSEPAIKSMKSLESMKNVIKYVELHYAEHITIEDAAEIASCSPSYFMKCFKKTFHSSFIDYLKNYRLTIAARMLTQSDGSVLEICENVGFDNLSYFIRSFKAKYGVTPGKYAIITKSMQ